MSENQNQNQNQIGEEAIDIGKIAENIGNELFGGDDSTPSTPEAASEGTPPLSEGVPASPASVPAASPPSYTPKALPKSWKKEMEAHWGKLPPEIHDYVYDREADVMRGIQMYKQGHDQWGQVLQPFQPVLKEHPELNTVQLLQNLMNSHISIVRGSPEQKKALAQQLLKSYGIDLGQGQAQSQEAPSALQTELAQVRQELNQLKQGWTQAQQAQYQNEVEAEKVKISEFKADPKNKYFDEVAADILRLISTGVAPDLKGAYEQACWLSPGVRAKMMAEQSSIGQPSDGAKPKPTNINGSGEGTPKPRKPATIDDTINSVINKHYGTH